MKPKTEEYITVETMEAIRCAMGRVMEAREPLLKALDTFQAALEADIPQWREAQKVMTKAQDRAVKQLVMAVFAVGRAGSIRRDRGRHRVGR